MAHAEPQPSPSPVVEDVVALTENAIEHFREALRKEGLGPDFGLRVGVTEGGCSGYSYAVSFENERRANDLVVEQGGLTVYVDADSASHLRGVTIDFVESLHGSAFKFVNPNATRTCGCGTSFS